jgi:toxin ParE1/3/4
VTILFSNSALSDLDEIKRYYLELGAVEVGDDIVASAFSHIETLVDHPDIGRVVPEFEQQHIRELRSMSLKRNVSRSAVLSSRTDMQDI